MKKSIIFVALLLSACHAGAADLSKVQKGMTVAQVQSAVGDAERKTDVGFGFTWMIYGKSAVVVQSGVVENVIPDTEAYQAQVTSVFKDFRRK